jgi:hypothetical protein
MLCCDVLPLVAQDLVLLSIYATVCETWLVYGWLQMLNIYLVHVANEEELSCASVIWPSQQAYCSLQYMATIRCRYRTRSVLAFTSTCRVTRQHICVPQLRLQRPAPVKHSMLYLLHCRMPSGRLRLSHPPQLVHLGCGPCSRSYQGTTTSPACWRESPHTSTYPGHCHIVCRAFVYT